MEPKKKFFPVVPLTFVLPYYVYIYIYFFFLLDQVHLREFYELNSRSHEVYEWARGVDLPEGTTPHLLFRNLTPDVQAEMTRLVKEDWMGLRRILPELLQATEQFNEAEPLLRQVSRAAIFSASSFLPSQAF